MVVIIVVTRQIHSIYTVRAESFAAPFESITTSRCSFEASCIAVLSKFFAGLRSTVFWKLSPKISFIIHKFPKRAVAIRGISFLFVPMVYIKSITQLQ